MKKNFTKHYSTKFDLNNRREASIYQFLCMHNPEAFFRLIEDSSMYQKCSGDLSRISDDINQVEQIKFDLTN